MCQDYEPNSDAWPSFYRNTQAKLIYAGRSNTPAEIIKHRADVREPYMGLQTWPNDNIRKADVSVSKNYLAHTEIKELNRLTTILLDIFEDQLDLGKAHADGRSRGFAESTIERPRRGALRTGGRVAMTDAKASAEREYEKFKAKLAEQRHAEADVAISEIKGAGKSLPNDRVKR